MASTPAFWKSKGRSCSRRSTTSSRSIRIPAKKIGGSTRTTPRLAQGVSRGPAFFENMLFRGTQDGRVLAYDFKTGKRLWESPYCRPEERRKRAGPRPSHEIGLVFIGNAGGDVKGVKGRITRSTPRRQNRREFYLVPKSPEDISAGRSAFAAHRLDLEHRRPASRSQRRHLDFLHAGSEQWRPLRARRQSGS